MDGIEVKDGVHGFAHEMNDLVLTLVITFKSLTIFERQITFSRSSPRTYCSKWRGSAFCTSKLLKAIPMTLPKLRQRSCVVLVTAWSSFELKARLETEVGTRLMPLPGSEKKAAIVAPATAAL